MNTRSVWSGGVKWSSGTPTADRTNAYWLPDGATPSGRLMPDVAIGGKLYTTVQSASWGLGIDNFLSDLSPNLANVSLTGQVTAVPGDDVVITTGLGTQWVGRLDTITDDEDAKGNHWTSITATDRIGGLGAAQLDTYATAPLTGHTLEYIGELLASNAGISLDITDDSASGLINVSVSSDPLTTSVLSVIATTARASNAMMALQRDGTISAVVRESVTPSSVLTLTGVNAPTSWTLSTSIDVDVNQWWWVTPIGEDSADVALYGARSYVSAADGIAAAFSTPFDDWVAYGGSQRPVMAGGFIVTAWSQTALILLNPFEWVTRSGTDWQVMSVRHDVTPSAWTVAITADNLLDLL